MTRVSTARYGADAARRLRVEVARAQGDDPLAPVTVVVSNGPVGLSTRRRLAAMPPAPGAGRAGLVNVRFLPLARLADELGAGALAARGRSPLTEAVAHAAARAALHAAGDAFGPGSQHPGTVRAVVETYRDLRRAGPETWARLAAGSFRGAAMIAVARAMGARLTSFSDDVDVLEAAVVAAASGPRPATGPIVVHLPASLSVLEERLLRALEWRVGVTFVIGFTGDAVADEAAQTLVERLASAGADVVDADLPAAVPTITVTSAPSADAEALLAVRALMERMEAGIPLERMAVVHGGVAPYPRLVREQLTAAGVPWNGAGVRTLAETASGRALLGALSLPDHDWRRDDVIAWLATAPILAGRDEAPVSRWDLLSRRAGVVAGLAEWDGRLRDHAEARRSAAAEPDGDDDARARRLKEAEQADALHAFVTGLAARFDHPPTSWRAWSAWADDLFTALLGGTARRRDWSNDEVEAHDAVRHALAGLAALDPVAPAPDTDTFRAALAAELGVLAPQTSRAGHGVFVGRLRGAVGLQLAAAFVVGMTDGAFPPRPADDAVVPDRERAAAGDDLPLRAERAADARRDFAAVMTGCESVWLSFARHDQRQGREQRPSRWLLDALAVATGHQHLTRRDLEGLSHPAYRFAPSYTAAVAGGGAPASLADRDLRALLARRAAGGRPEDCALVRDDPVLRRGFAVLRERRGAAFTRFDGRIAGVAVPSPATGEPQSPTGLESYATCPRQYLFSKLLRITVVERPERIVRMSPADRGTLVHAVLERFIMDEVDKPVAARIAPPTAWGAAGEARLLSIAEDAFAQAEKEGLTGRPTIWAYDRAAIRRDLRRFLREDDRRRMEAGATPAAVELRFGGDDGPTVAAELAPGRRIRFKGLVDRVDTTVGGGLVVTDYKTGSQTSYAKVESDFVGRGTHLQLPIYALAAQALLGDAPASAWYWFVSQRGKFDVRGYELGDEAWASFHAALDTLVDGIERGVFPAHPGEVDRDSFQNCRYCDFDAACPSDRQRQWDRVGHAPELARYVGLVEGPAAENGASATTG